MTVDVQIIMSSTPPEYYRTGLLWLDSSNLNSLVLRSHTSLGWTPLNTSKGEGEVSYTGYSAENIIASSSIELKLQTESVLTTTLTSANNIAVTLATPVADKINESILIFKVGASIPTITHPSGTKWRGAAPDLKINGEYTIVYEQVKFGSTWEVWAVVSENEIV